MYIKIGSLIITTEEVVPKKEVIDEKKLKGAFSARLTNQLRSNCADEILDSALIAAKNA